MFHMLTCFDLRPEHTIDDFHQSLGEFAAELSSANLVHSCGPIGRRIHHPVMDTDDERDHEFFFIMSFLDHAQCDRAVDFIRPRTEPTESLHNGAYSKIENAIFICWEDVPEV